MRDLFEAGIGEDSGDISSALAGPCFSATVLRMEVSESIVCLQLHFEYDGSAPLVQQNLPAKSDLENCYSFNVVFSSDTSTYRFTGKPVSQTTGLYYDYQRWYDPTTGRFISEDRFPGIVSDPQSLNGYTYASDSPTVVTDPTGLSGYVPNVNVSTGSCPSFWNNPWGSFSCQLSRTPTPVADVVASYDLAAWGIEACWEDCGQLLSDAGSLLGGDTTATTGSDVTAISRTGPTTSVTGDVTIGTDTTRVVTSDNPATLTSETSQLTRDSNWAPNPGGRLGGSLHRQVVNDIAEFIKSRGLTPDREYYFQSVHRFADVVALDGPGGSPVEIYQVGRMTSQSLLPVAREIYAAGDILDALGIPVVFVPYNV